MKNYFKRRKFVCTHTLKMDSGQKSFIKNKVYTFKGNTPNGYFLKDEQGSDHEVTHLSWGLSFIEIKGVE